MIKKFLLPLILIMTMIFAGCSGTRTKLPSGTYEAGSELGKTVYTFDDNDSVTVRYVSFGHTLLQKNGTFSLDESGELITLKFDVIENETLPGAMTALSGTFSYKTGENNEIYIGNVCYTKTDVSFKYASDTGSIESPSSEPVTGHDEPVFLSGTYSRKIYDSGTEYSFRDGNSIIIKTYAAGYEVYSSKGTYSIDAENMKIAMTFPANIYGGGAASSNGATTITRTYDFEKGEEYIIIGAERYDRAKTVQNPNNTPNNFSQGGDFPAEVKLALPEQYRISYNITEAHGFSRTYTQTMIKNDNGIVLFLGDGGTDDRYIFKKQDSGKYIMYQYDRAGGRYITPMISDAVWEQIGKGNMTLDMIAMNETSLSGYTTRVSSCFDFYNTFRGQLRYEGDEKSGVFACQKYTASFENMIGKQNIEAWILPEYGLCIRAAYGLEPMFGVSSSKVIECIEFETENIELPSIE